MSIQRHVFDNLFLAWVVFNDLMHSLYAVRLWKRGCNYPWLVSFLRNRHSVVSSNSTRIWAWVLVRQPKQLVKFSDWLLLWQTLILFAGYGKYGLLHCLRYLWSVLCLASVTSASNDCFFSPSQLGHLNQPSLSKCEQGSWACSLDVDILSTGMASPRLCNWVPSSVYVSYCRCVLRLSLISKVGDTLVFRNVDCERLCSFFWDLSCPFSSADNVLRVTALLSHITKWSRWDSVTCRTKSRIWIIMCYAIISGMLTRYVKCIWGRINVMTVYLAFVHLPP